MATIDVTIMVETNLISGNALVPMLQLHIICKYICTYICNNYIDYLNKRRMIEYPVIFKSAAYFFDCFMHEVYLVGYVHTCAQVSALIANYE